MEHELRRTGLVGLDQRFLDSLTIRKAGPDAAFFYIPVEHSIPVQEAQYSILNRMTGLELEPVSEEDLHITLLHLEKVKDEELEELYQEINRILPLVFEVQATSSGKFYQPDTDTPVIIRINAHPALLRLQQEIFNAAFTLELDISKHSFPTLFMPHITIANSLEPPDAPIPDLEEPFKVGIDRVVVSRGDYDKVRTIYLPVMDRLLAKRSPGGAGSGHFEHAGREGEVGGSAPSGATATKEEEGGLSKDTKPSGDGSPHDRRMTRQEKRQARDAEGSDTIPTGKDDPDLAQKAFNWMISDGGMEEVGFMDAGELYLSPDGRFVSVDWHAKAAASFVHETGIGKEFNVSQKDIDDIDSGGVASNEAMSVTEDLIDAGLVRLKIRPNFHSAIEASPGLTRKQRGAIADVIAAQGEGMKYQWSYRRMTDDPMGKVTGKPNHGFLIEDFMDLAGIEERSLIERAPGGAGSGHFEHAGREGEVGGSQPGKGGGAKRIGEAADSREVDLPPLTPRPDPADNELLRQEGPDRTVYSPEVLEREIIRARSNGLNMSGDEPEEIIEWMADIYEKQFGWKPDEGYTREAFVDNWKNNFEQGHIIPVDPEFYHRFLVGINDGIESGIISASDVQDVPILLQKIEQPTTAANARYNINRGWIEINQTGWHGLTPEGMDERLWTEGFLKTAAPGSRHEGFDGGMWMESNVSEYYEDEMVGHVLHELGHHFHLGDPEKEAAITERARWTHNLDQSLDAQDEATDMIKRNISYYASVGLGTEESKTQELVAECYAIYRHPEYDQWDDASKEVVEYVLFGSGVADDKSTIR